MFWFVVQYVGQVGVVDVLFVGGWQVYFGFVQGCQYGLFGGDLDQCFVVC